MNQRPTSGQDTSSYGWTNIDQTGESERFIGFLENRSANEQIQAMKRRMQALLETRAGNHILDIGCGTGDDALALAQVIGADGRVVGIDNSEAMVMEARSRAQNAALPVEFRVADAHQLDFPDNSFDGCRAERVLMYVRDPRQVLAEVVRVCRPGAPVVILEPDLETNTVDMPDRALTRRIVTAGADVATNPWIGRQLPGIFRGVGLRDITVEPYTQVATNYAVATQMGFIVGLERAAQRAQQLGIISLDEVVAWSQFLEEAKSSGIIFYSRTFFLVRGCKV